MSMQDNSMANEAARLEAENRELRAKLEAAERERDEARQIISLSKGLRNDSNPIYAEVKQLREQRDALAAALRKVRHMVKGCQGLRMDEEWEQLAENLSRILDVIDDAPNFAAILAERDRAKDEQISAFAAALDKISANYPPQKTDPLPQGRHWCVNGCNVNFTGNPGGCAMCTVMCMRGKCEPGCRVCNPAVTPDPAAILAEHDREVRRKALEEAVQEIEQEVSRFVLHDPDKFLDGLQKAVGMLRRMAERQA